MLHEQCVQKWEFLRGFSDLGRLQKSATVWYTCRQNGSDGYRFFLKRECAGRVDCETAVVHKIESSQAQQMLQYLYENAVPMENWTDVLMELQKIV